MAHSMGLEQEIKVPPSPDSAMPDADVSEAILVASALAAHDQPTQPAATGHELLAAQADDQHQHQQQQSPSPLPPPFLTGNEREHQLQQLAAAAVQPAGPHDPHDPPRESMQMDLPVEVQVHHNNVHVAAGIAAGMPVSLPGPDMSSSPALAAGPMLQQQSLPPGQKPLPGQPPAPGELGAPVIKRRAGIACRRCRRMRSKCVHDKGKPPCQGCRELGGAEAAECSFPTRGQPDHDREYRHPRMRQDKTAAVGGRRDSVRGRRATLDATVSSLAAVASAGNALLARGLSGSPSFAVNLWDYLPPQAEIIEAFDQFARHYFQLGFIAKDMFVESLHSQPSTVSPFFLLSLLSVSARMTPSLVQRHGTAARAAEYYIDMALQAAVSEIYKEPSLPRCQAFYLLSVAQQGSAIKAQSAINMSVAVCMATLMQLHREEWYTKALESPTREAVIAAESARRTLWMLHSHDNLNSGPESPVTLSVSDITALLPCNEEDFALGRLPKSRAALMDTPPALENPQLVSDPGRSLFASLVQVHYYWGIAARRARSHDKSPEPWEEDSEYARVVQRLKDWEDNLPADHRWSPVLLKGYKHQGQDLAYLGVTRIIRLCNIVVRKAYINEIIADDKSSPRSEFWAKMSHDLFQNVKDLYDQIDTQYSDRNIENGIGAQISVFCVYTCGFLATYLWRYPTICDDETLTARAPELIRNAIVILDESRKIWPLATRWYDHLTAFARGDNGLPPGEQGTMVDSREPLEHPLFQVLANQLSASDAASHTGAAGPAPGTDPSQSPDMLMVQQQEGQQENQHQAQGPANSSPTPNMFIDPSLRINGQDQSGLPSGLPNGLSHSPQSPQEQTQAQQHERAAAIAAARQQLTNGLGLLLEASQNQQYYQPATGQGGAAGAEDGYEQQLSFYMTEGAPSAQSWSDGM